MHELKECIYEDECSSIRGVRMIGVRIEVNEYGTYIGMLQVREHN